MIITDALSWHAHRLGHGEVDWKLDHLEMVFRAADFMSDRYELCQAQMIPSIGQHAETVPRRATVNPDHTSLYLLLECRERFPHHIDEFWSIPHLQLLLGIVEVVDIDHLEPEVVATPFDLIVEIAWSKTVASCHDITGLHHAALEVLAIEEAVICLLGRRSNSVERDVTAFGTDNNLLSLDGTHRNRVSDPLTNGALRTLTAIVDCGIDKVDPFVECRGRRGCITFVFEIIALAKVCSETERRNEWTMRQLAIKVFSVRPGEALAKALRSIGCRPAFNQSCTSFSCRC